MRFMTTLLKNPKQTALFKSAVPRYRPAYTRLRLNCHASEERYVADSPAERAAEREDLWGYGATEIFNAASRESGLLKLPIEMLAAIFKHMAERGFVFWVSKIVKDRLPQSHIHHVSQTVEIWRGADDGSARLAEPS